MDGIILVVLLILGLPVLIGIWLISRAINARDRIEELSRRVERLEWELRKTKESAAATPESSVQKVADKVAAFGKPAVPPEPAAAPIPPPSPIPPAPSLPEAKPVPAETPIPAPFVPATLPPKRPAPEPLDAPAPKTYVRPSPAIVPPPRIPKPAPVAAPAPEPVFQSAPVEAADIPPAEPVKDSFEMRVGKVWLVRAGAIVFLTALAFGANLAYQNIVPKLGPGGKLSLLYLASALLLGAGAWWQRRNVKESLKKYAQVLFAGGLAAVYFTTYAAHYAPPVAVIDSALIDGILLFVWAAFIAVIADRQKSEVMALFAIGLAFFTSVITRVGEFTLYSNLLLTVAAVVFLVRNRWAALSFASLVTSYAGYAFWRFLHPDGWHWALPGESLWLGAGFLAAYWTVFTAATFLSRSERLTGHSRAAFLTLNNGAFFALFLLTMLQVRTGGFWKFSLIYGCVLLALSFAARRFLAAEPLAKNSYLTHGLVLITLGFISKFAGLQLALVLGAESVVLYVFSTQRRSTVLKFFAYAAAFLAVGWCAVTLEAFQDQRLWMAAGLGAMLAFNAYWALRAASRGTDDPNRVECITFGALAFGCWTFAAWFNSPEPHFLAMLVPAIAAAVFYNLLGGYKVIAPKFAAYFNALVAVIWVAVALDHEPADGLWIAIGIGAVMLINVLRAHRIAADAPEPFRPEPSVWTILALASWLAVTWFDCSTELLPFTLTIEAVALTFSIYLLRVREIAMLGQAFLLLAQAAWLFQNSAATPPWWSPATVIAATVGLSHWWQRQNVVPLARAVFQTGAAVFALAAVAIALLWLHPLLTAPGWLVLTSLLAVAVTAYGLLTRAWMLAIAGQIFLVVSIFGFWQAIARDLPDWYFPLAPLVVLAGLSLVTVAWFKRQSDAQPEIRQPLLQIALIYRWLALAMSLAWIWDYVPDIHRPWACIVAAAAVFAVAVWRRSREALAAAAVYAGVSLACLWLHDRLSMPIYVPNLFTLLALFALQQILRRRSKSLPLDDNIHGAILIVAGVSLWRYLSCWTAPHAGDFSMTMTWAGFAVIAFSAGIMLHERFLRWLGLGVLAAAIGRVVIVDVWHQATLGRVLTFMALGVALFVVGFIYNKYEEKIREWL